MSDDELILAASPFMDNVLALPVEDLDKSTQWCRDKFSFEEVERIEHPHPTVIMERDGVRIGYSINGGNPEEEGAAIRVSNIYTMREELEAKGISTGNWRVDDWDGEKHQVFFVVAPDRLCYVFTQPLEEIEQRGLAKAKSS